jgi:tRNA A58 N-methylase Trm61
MPLQVLRHRTQILNVADISLVVANLALAPCLPSYTHCCLCAMLLQVLRHRTQILYVADISLVVANLALTPGNTVLESGTGSGSLTHSLARAVAPHGRVYTFDFHKLRADEAQAEFDRHGLSGMVIGGHRNIEEQGFPQVS